MLFIQYLIALFLGFIMGSFSLIVITIICRVGLPLCRYVVKEGGYPIEVAKFQRNKYIISLIIQIFIYAIITFICYKLLYRTFYAYLFSSIFILLLNISKTGKTPTNVNEFYRNLTISKIQYCNKER